MQVLVLFFSFDLIDQVNNIRLRKTFLFLSFSFFFQSNMLNLIVSLPLFHNFSSEKGDNNFFSLSLPYFFSFQTQTKI